MWDEFETVLQFLVRYRAADSLGEALKPFFAMANEHCMVTSRVIVVLLYEITGQANFIHLAIIGDLFIVGVVVLFALQQETLQARLVALAMVSLLVFQLQHHENLFSSYASIDHFLVVLLTTVTLVLSQRKGIGGTLAFGSNCRDGGLHTRARAGGAGERGNPPRRAVTFAPVDRLAGVFMARWVRSMAHGSRRHR
jgi:hypothetical protein